MIKSVLKILQGIVEYPYLLNCSNSKIIRPKVGCQMPGMFIEVSILVFGVWKKFHFFTNLNAFFVQKPSLDCSTFD
jgi:hypothetical protein